MTLHALLQFLAEAAADPSGPQARHFADAARNLKRNNAQWWWQFAAGGGESNAAYALYVHHAALGELRDAEHYFHETARLTDQSNRSLPTAPPPPSIPQIDLYLFNIPWHSQHLPGDTTDLARPDPKLRSTVDDLDAVRADDRLGAFVLPTETIAAQLHDLVCP
ncbi:hypothetical protein ABZW30_43890 [Kitasatospora sp. NPDC004669]|uniref:hypothetical protein n=1 Tax=Kitasatospora sp. NPDC004669 TaxID=3154555 RepID=UPI0033B8A68E